MATSSFSSSAQASTGVAPTLTFCQTYSGTTTNATAQINLLTAIVVRAAVGGIFADMSSTTAGATVLIPGLFNASGPLYNIFTGITQYRVGAPNYLTNIPQQTSLVGHLVGYFGALFGCTATGYTPVNTPNMYAVHQNMSINQAMETYFNTQLALTLQSFGVPASVIAGPASTALGYFNRCGAPIAAISATAPVQICGTSDCGLATGATYATCVQYYNYPAAGSSSSTAGSNDATGKYALSVASAVLATIVASLML